MTNRFIKNLTFETISLLERLYKSSRYPRVRQRAHCILLSHKGYTVTELTDIFGVSKVTVYNWFNGWEATGLVSLYDKKGKGRKRKLLPEHSEKIKQWVRQFPKNLSKVASLIQEEFGISVKKKTIKRFLKSVRVTWRRVRRKPKGEPDPKEYEQKTIQLDELKEQDRKGEIDLRYGDASGFSLESNVPYAWQEIGKTIEIETGHSKRFSVFGFMNVNHDLQAYTIEGTLDSQILVALIDDFCKTINKKTVIVLDCSPIHTSKLFLSKIPQWEILNLEIFYLPKYSPELNLIEILWRFIKYIWIEFDAYLSIDNLILYVEKVIKGFGTDYKINFV